MKRWPWWVFAGVLLPLGMGGFAIAVPGIQKRKPLWIALAALTIAAFLTGAVLAETTSDANNVEGAFFVIGWVLSICAALGLRKPYLALQEQQPSAWETAKVEGRRRLRERREALALIASDLELARQIGVGRPDQRGAQDAGLLDVNHVPAHFIAKLPGFDDALAERVVAIREDVNGFSTLADFGAVADLDGNLVERIRDHVVFLPR